MTVKITNGAAGFASAMAQALASGDEQAQVAAWTQLHESLVERITSDMEEYRATQDAAALAARGYRQLTSAETKWYQRLVEVMKSASPKQAFVDILGEDIEDNLMPETIIEDVYRDLAEDHALLSHVNFTYVKYATRWVLNDHTAQKATWGEITDEITKQITSGFKVVSVHQNKLSAFCFVEKGMLDLGPTFLDAYVRAVLAECMYAGLEHGIVTGNGLNEPAGLDRDIHEGVEFSTTTGYPKKAAVAVTELTPATYGALLKPLAKTEGGHSRAFTQVQLLVNQADYLTKVMPATTVLGPDGRYLNDIFPFPTEVIITNELAEGEALIGLLGEYTVFAGGQNGGVIEFSDEFKFTDDVRYFKVKQYATGRAADNTCFQRLDISGLKPTYPTVNTIVSGSAEDPTA